MTYLFSVTTQPGIETALGNDFNLVSGWKDNPIRWYNCDKNVCAAISWYLDILDLFMALLSAFTAGNS